MKLKKICSFILVIALVFCAGCGNNGGLDHKGTSIHFINVNKLADQNGTSTCVLIRHNDQTILVDSGDEQTVSKQTVKSYLKKEGVKKIDHLILTNVSNETAGGAIYQIENFDIGALYVKPMNWSVTKKSANRPSDVQVLYDDVYLAVQHKANSDRTFVSIVIPNEEGYRVQIDKDTYFEIYNCTELYDNQYIDQDYKELSMQIKFTHKNVSAFIGGGANSSSDHLLVNKVGECELYSLQGQGNALPYTSQVLVDELTPSICVVNGTNEDIDSATRSRCEIFADNFYVTGEKGNIIFDCDGKHFNLRAN